jgi:hypothetical protein
MKIQYRVGIDYGDSTSHVLKTYDADVMADAVKSIVARGLRPTVAVVEVARRCSAERLPGPGRPMRGR